ncbi:MAG: GIY-YIG nuclease family protein [bacterium]
MYTVYVLRDKTDWKLYKGVTNDMKRRLFEHKRGKTKTTRCMQDIEVVYIETYNDFADARKCEIYLKTAAERRFIKKVLNNKGV